MVAAHVVIAVEAVLVDVVLAEGLLPTSERREFRSIRRRSPHWGNPRHIQKVRRPSGKYSLGEHLLGSTRNIQNLGEAKL